MFKKILSFFSASASSLWTFLQPIASAEVGKVLASLLPVAKDIVIEVATTGKLPNEKRDLAYSKLKDAAAIAGTDVTNSVLNAAIELAYQHVKATQPEALNSPK